ncbi:MAG: carboxymuconolactone decarboxylase family protein, partial [Hyphomicrobium sp.]
TLAIETATGKVKALMEGAKQWLGFVPNMYAAMANEPALYQAYASGYAAFRSECGFTPIEQEVIFLVISRENGCNYCMAAHSFIADTMSNVPLEVTEAIRDGKAIADRQLQALAAFTAKMVSSRGRVSDADSAAFKSFGYSEKNILGIILAISMKTLSNYTHFLFDLPLDTEFSGRAWTARS